MPLAVTHILVPILIVAIFRDFYLRKKDKKDCPLHYVLIAGLGGILPDIDILISIILNLAGIPDWDVHKTFTHSLFFTVIFLILFLVIPKGKARNKNVSKQKLSLRLIFLMIAVGTLTHIILDALLGGEAFFFYPFSLVDYSIHLFSYLPKVMRDVAFPILDGILLIIWVVYLELKHKISDFI